MSRIEKAVYELNSIEDLSRQNRWVNRLHPSVKLLLTLLLAVLAVSFDKYDLPGLMGLFVYPLFVFIAGGLRFKDALKRLWIVLPLVMITGIANPFFDRQVHFYLGAFAVTGGMVSMATLIVKGILCILGAYILIATTPIEGICRSLRAFRVPKIIVTVILLIYRYVTVLLQEADRVTNAYLLRAPSEKGIGIRAWGPLAGGLLLRSMDRAQVLYESMQLRGFNGEFPEGLHALFYEGRDNRRMSIVYFAVWVIILICLRIVPVAGIVGSVFGI